MFTVTLVAPVVPWAERRPPLETLKGVVELVPVVIALSIVICDALQLNVDVPAVVVVAVAPSAFTLAAPNAKIESKTDPVKTALVIYAVDDLTPIPTSPLLVHTTPSQETFEYLAREMPMPLQFVNPAPGSPLIVERYDCSPRYACALYVAFCKLKSIPITGAMQKEKLRNA